MPDGWITPLILQFAVDSRFHHVQVNREESAIGLCSGAFFSGIGALALMGASGFLTCIYAITKINYTYQIPLTTDGSAASVDVGKNARVYCANWVGANLAIKWNEDGERKETWTLSQDGRALAIVGSAELTDDKFETWKYVMTKK